MADRLMLMQAIATAAALTLSAGSNAQTLTDPTRPPLGLIAAAAGMDKGATGTAARPRLESILLSSTRKGAIINGQYVPLGGSYGKSTLVDVMATGVTLKTGRKREVLKLYPPLETPSAAFGVGGEPEKVVKRP
ncbi:MAG TPA: MSHA biogenesis protein MshK [Burkholderiales bacterium]|nr:MSHA biogenesis protein MshK [Burkholderiales bacterium]